MKILPLLDRLIPSGLAFKGLQKLDPRIGRFVSGAVAAGYTTEEVLENLRERFQPNANPDENFGNTPEGLAAKRQVENSKQGPKIATTAASVAGGLAGGLAANYLLGDEEEQQGIPLPGAGLPKLPYTPTKALPSPEQAGYEKQAPIPKSDQAIPMGMKRRKGANDAADQEIPIVPVTDEPGSPYSLLAEYDPKFAEAIKGLVQKGWTPDGDGMKEIAYLKFSGPYVKAIAQMENESGMSFVQIMKKLFGKQQKAAENKGQQLGKGAQQVMGVLDKVRQTLGRK